MELKPRNQHIIHRARIINAWCLFQVIKCGLIKKNLNNLKFLNLKFFWTRIINGWCYIIVSIFLPGKRPFLLITDFCVDDKFLVRYGNNYNWKNNVLSYLLQSTV